MRESSVYETLKLYSILIVKLVYELIGLLIEVINSHLCDEYILDVSYYVDHSGPSV